MESSGCFKSGVSCAEPVIRRKVAIGIAIGLLVMLGYNVTLVRMPIMILKEMALFRPDSSMVSSPNPDSVVDGRKERSIGNTIRSCLDDGSYTTIASNTKAAAVERPRSNIKSIYDGRFNFTEPSKDMFINWSIDTDIDWKIDRMVSDPIPFLPTYKNPCWFESLPYTHSYSRNVYRVLIGSTFKKKVVRPMSKVLSRRRREGFGWRLRCLPYFYIPGISKCGTTDLYKALTSHPDISFPPLKEPVYWNRIRLDVPQHSIGWLRQVLPKIKHVPVPRPFRDYVDLYDNAAETIRKSVRVQISPLVGATEYHYKITGDATPSYMYDFDGWMKVDINKGRSEPKYTIADLIHEVTPQAKIIIILRDPSDRLFSDYKYFDRNSIKNVDDFHSRAKIAIQKMKECLATRSVRSCIYDRNLTTHSMPLRIRVGMYHPFLLDWFKRFHRKNIFITRVEDYGKHRTQVLSSLFDFLDLTQTSSEFLLRDPTKRKVVNKSVVIGSLKYGMRNDTRHMINEFYKSWNHRLASLLQDSRFLWEPNS